VDIRKQLPHVILQVENSVFDFVTRWRQLCYKFVQHKVNRCVHSQIVLKSTKITQISSDVLKI